MQERLVINLKVPLCFKLNRVFVVAVNFLQIDDVTLERRCFICLVVSRCSQNKVRDCVNAVKRKSSMTL